jgi:26S proteasome regulatory subunit N13
LHFYAYILLRITTLLITELTYPSATGSAPTDASSLVQNLLNSLKTPGSGSGSQQQSKQFCSLADLLTSDTCIPILSSAPPAYLDTLLNALPPALILLETSPKDLSGTEPTPAALASAIASLSESQKRSILTRVLRSAQLRQSLGSLTAAIREGGLPSVAEGLQIKVANGGLVRGGSVPLGGGEAVEAFVTGVRKTVKEEGDGDAMDVE